MMKTKSLVSASIYYRNKSPSSNYFSTLATLYFMFSIFLMFKILCEHLLLTKDDKSIFIFNNFIKCFEDISNHHQKTYFSTFFSYLQQTIKAKKLIFNSINRKLLKVSKHLSSTQNLKFF